MPTIDAGHYFFTALIPVRTEPVKIYDTIVTTPILALRETLASLPTAHQSQACLPGYNSPFARNTRNHLARFVIIDTPAFNGRVQPGTLVTTIRNINPVIPQAVDRLSTPFLMFSSDFNCIVGDDSDLESYLRTLWETMGAEWRAILPLCIGADSVGTAADFVACMKRCQIETTMPFHDYWIDMPQLPTLPLPLIGGVAFIGLLALLIGFWSLVAHGHVLSWLVLTLVGAGAFFGIYKYITIRGSKPFPAAHGADLPGVLKSLYLQRQFTRFAVDNQAAKPDDLYAGFAAFLYTHQPSHTAAPTQAPGTIGA
jgi:hypothetical protein